VATSWRHFAIPVFARARVENYGAAITWDDGDLAIDAYHLKKLADEQKPFDPIMMQAHLRPRVAGRPRKAAS
jgi:hypothetical protein